MSDKKSLNKTKKCPKYYRRDEKTGICEYQEKKSFKVNSEGLLEIPEEFRELVIAEKGVEFFKNNYEIITDKEKKKGRVKGILFTSEKNKTRRKKSDNTNISSNSILLENTPANKSAAKSPVPSLPTDISPSKEIDIHVDGKPAIINEDQNQQKSIIAKPLPKKIRIKKSNKIIEIREPNIMDALRDAKDTNDAYINHLLDYDPAGEKEQPPENVPLEKSKKFHQIEKTPIIVDKTPSDSELNYDFLYPSLDDPEFNVKLSKHKEFFDTKYDGKIYDFKKHAESMCHADFELSPHQIFVKNFMSVQTPYNSLLMYHGLGVGKTCSAIGVAEEMRSYMKQIGMRKQILVIASPNVQDNFRLQLFDESKLKFENGIWKMESCIGKKLLEEINPTNMNIPKERIVSQIKSIIKNYYYFMGYTQFANYINNSVELKSVGYSREEKLRIKIKKIKSVFNNRLIIIDEVHNIRITHENKNRKTAELLMEVAKYADNMRLLLLSATPMYNSYEEIIWLTNIMNLNDKRGTIKISDIFLKNGEFCEKDDKHPKNGRDLLVQKLTGYVTYVRGENPYTFPFRIYSEDSSFKNNVYPTLQMNGKPLDITKKLQNIPLYLNKVGEHQQLGYQFIIENMRFKNKDGLVHKETFDILNENVAEMDSFGYAVLQYPLEALNIVYPSDILYEPTTKIENIEENQQIIANMVGSQGLSNMMRYKDKTESDKMIRHGYEYLSDKHGRIFAPDNIGKYSAKIAKICEIIRKSEGIVLIYSQWIDSGLVPIALALEEMGFTRYGTESYTRPLLKTQVAEPIDSITMKTKTEFSAQPPTHAFHQSKYVMITGDPLFSPNNDADLKYLNQSKNKDGQFVKVVLISKAAAEGVDFKNIRQIHVMEPWFNMNRIEQIIGRGVRNFSHCQLPFEKRNVEIFLHATLLNNNEESSDLYVYRLAEKKSMKIGRISRLLKETAVDCILNIAQTNFTAEKLVEMGKNQTVKIQTASGKKIDFKVGDKPHTPICDYMDNCNYTCSPMADIQESDVIKTTYNDEFLHNNHDLILKRIRNLFIDIPGQEQQGKIFFHEDELISSINIVKEYPIEQIYATLTYLIENKHEYLVDRYGRLGNLVNQDKYYLFQPIEITDERASIYERSRPVDVKHPSISIELSETIGEPIPIEQEKSQPKQDIHLFKTIVSRCQDNFSLSFLPLDNIVVNIGEKNWYKNMSVVSSHLTEEHNITIDDLQKNVVDHIVDELPVSDKLILLNEMYYNWKPTGIVETYIKEYFNDRMVVTEKGLIGMILSEDNKVTNVFIQSEKNPKIWEKAEFTDANTIIRSKSYSEKYIFNKERLNVVIGFMAWVENQNEYVFKIRDLNDSVNKKGARINQALMKDIIVKINTIIGTPFYTNENVKKFFGEGKNRLVVIIEILLRNYQETHKNNKIWFLNNEQILVNGILNYTLKK
jgi:hypothetical protein